MGAADPHRQGQCAAGQWNICHRGATVDPPVALTVA